MSLTLSYDIESKPGLQRHIKGYILLELQEMGASEMLQHIPEAVQARIKREDPSPVYRAYVVAHEGPSQGSIVGSGQMVKHWVQSAIRKVFDRLKTGLQLFHNHSRDNRHEGRTAIGELVGKTTSFIKEKLTAIAIAYIRPEFRSLPLDVASIEANITIPNGEKITAVNVDDVTGIALGNSKINRPGFSGAELIGELQAFVKNNQSYRRHLQMGDGEKITIDEIKTLIKEEKILPSDIFVAEDLTEDPFIKGHVKAEVKEAVAGEYGHRKRTDKAFEQREQEWTEEKKSLTEKIQVLTKTASESKLKTLFETAKTERKLSEQQAKFIEKRLKTFQPEDLDNLDKELGKHLDTELDEFKDYAETFGIETEAADGGDGKEKKEAKPKIKADPKEGSEEDVDNPFLPIMDDAD